MLRRKWLGLAGSIPLVLTRLRTANAGEEPPPNPGVGVGLPKDPRTSCFEQCDHLDKLCSLIADQCLEALKQGRGDLKRLVQLHRALSDCREFCAITGRMVIRDSPFRSSSCVACAEVCTRCAAIAKVTDFESKEQVIENLRDCATVCREVAELR